MDDRPGRQQQHRRLARPVDLVEDADAIPFDVTRGIRIASPMLLARAGVLRGRFGGRSGQSGGRHGVRRGPWPAAQRQIVPVIRQPSLVRASSANSTYTAEWMITLAMSPETAAISMRIARSGVSLCRPTPF